MSVEVTDSTFSGEVLNDELPVLVDFWADWCLPCHHVSPEVEAVGQDLAERLKVVKLDIDANPEIAIRYHVHSIPTLVLFINGHERHRVVGARPRTEIRQEIEPFLKAGLER
jgi:thioredoxin 1